MEFPNYKSLCDFISIPCNLQGKSKQLQVEELKLYFDFERIGTKRLKITEVYDIPKEKIDLRTKGIYVKHIEIILLQYLLKQEGYTTSMTRYDLWNLLGFINDKYNNDYEEHSFLTKNSHINPLQLALFKTRSHNKFNEILNASLESLAKRKLISYSSVIYITPNNNQEPFIANDEQIKNILSVEKEVLLFLDCYSMNQVYATFKNKEYYSRVNQLLLERYGWKSCHKMIKFIYSLEHLSLDLHTNILELERIEMNQLTKNALDKQAERQFKHYIDEITKEQQKMLYGDLSIENTPTYRKKKNIYPDNFIEIQKTLSEHFIRYIVN